jgi:hypothetical protein
MSARFRVACAALVAFAGGGASAQVTLERATVDAGGGRATGGPYAVTATMGQADAHRSMASATYRYQLAGGFWPDQRADMLFRDGFEDP